MKRFLTLLLIASSLAFINQSCSKPEPEEPIEENNKIEENDETINGHDYVDLGLPSGLKWATCNVGAESPEGYGDYFAWGEITSKEEYDISNSSTYEVKMNDISGNETYDAATANWGGTWRMPTRIEIKELIDNCTWTWTTQKGVNGCTFTGPNGKQIFFPAAGSCYSDSPHNEGESVRYWSSTPYDGDYDGNDYVDDAGDAYVLSSTDSYRLDFYWMRYEGLPVRPVSE